MFGEKMDITDSTGKKVKLGAFMNQIDRVENLADSQEHPLYALKGTTHSTQLTQICTAWLDTSNTLLLIS